jgi:hypothetical protein
MKFSFRGSQDESAWQAYRKWWSGRRGDPNHPAFDDQPRRVFSSYVFCREERVRFREVRHAAGVPIRGVADE